MRTPPPVDCISRVAVHLSPMRCEAQSIWRSSTTVLSWAKFASPDNYSLDYEVHCLALTTDFKEIALTSCFQIEACELHQPQYEVSCHLRDSS